MGRSVVAVIVAYVSMFILNLLVFVGLYTLVGPAQAFKPASYLASNRWIAMSFVAIIITAIIAGLICAAIARGGRAPLAMRCTCSLPADPDPQTAALTAWGV